MFVLWLVLIMELWVINDYISKICGDWGMDSAWGLKLVNLNIYGC
jgi:hypothetical protein